MKLSLFCTLLALSGIWWALAARTDEGPLPDGSPVLHPSRDLTRSEPGADTVCVLPHGDAAQIPQIELSFTTPGENGRTGPLELEAIDLLCERTGWGCVYRMGSHTLRLGVGDRQRLRELVPGLVYTVLRDGYEPASFEVPPVGKGECARVELCLVRES